MVTSRYGHCCYVLRRSGAAVLSLLLCTFRGGPWADTHDEAESRIYCWMQYICLGASAFDVGHIEEQRQQRKSPTDPVDLPYCEGIEVRLAVVAML